MGNMTINGWQRVVVVACAAWLVGATAYFEMDVRRVLNEYGGYESLYTNHECRHRMHDILQFDECVEGAKGSYRRYTATSTLFWSFKRALRSLFVLGLLLGVGYSVYRWVRSGFKAND